jgi:hypothetical protein
MAFDHSIDGNFFYIHDTLLSPEECAAIIERLDKPEELKLVDSGLALYERNIWVSEEFAAVIKERVLPVLPADMRQYASINPWFRFSKYSEGGEFKVHRDGINQDAQGRRAMYTVNIFLNDGFEGGETTFFNHRVEVAHVAVPKPGRGAIFYNQITHCGCVVKATAAARYKYLIRTDVMI